MNYKNFLIYFFLIVLVVPFFASAQIIDEESSFYIEPSFSDENPNYEERAILAYSANNIYFYIDSSEWSSKTEEEQADFKNILKDISFDFKENKAKIVSIFGSEKTPGIDNDPNLTVLLYPMKKGASGYVRTVDQYEKILAPMSNEREMIYINIDTVESPFIDSFIIHEFTHLINLKNKTQQLDPTWLAELYSEFSAISIEEDENVYSYLDQRIKDFFKDSSNALFLWEGDIEDYGIVTIFGKYITDNYGEKILGDAMKSKKTGVESIEEALSRNGYTETFQDLYRNFLITLAINDCSKSDKYCFKSSKLTHFKVLPFNNFLPYSGEATISIGQDLYNYSPQWQKFSGGSGELSIGFDGEDNAPFRIIYIAEKDTGKYVIGDFELNEENQGALILSNMGDEYVSVTIIPRVEDKTLNPESFKKFNYNIVARIVPYEEEEEEEDPEEIIEEEEEEPTGSVLETVFGITKPLNELTTKELLILIVKILLVKNGYEI